MHGGGEFSQGEKKCVEEVFVCGADKAVGQVQAEKEREREMDEVPVFSSVMNLNNCSTVRAAERQHM